VLSITDHNYHSSHTAFTLAKTVNMKGVPLYPKNCNKTVDIVTKDVTILSMIKSFKHKGLVELFERGRSRRMRQDLQSRCLRRLEALDQAESLTDLNVPGFNFHGLQGVPKRYSIHINGPWCITFEWQEGEALRVDLEQYH
jgi:proteic killer suppression protein